jgi:hypothetical protein
MSDRVRLTLLAALAFLMIGFAAIWPQGLGERSPWIFGHAPVLRSPAMQAALMRATVKANKQIADAKAAAEAAKKAAADRNGPLHLAPQHPPAPAPKPPAAGGLRPGQ